MACISKCILHYPDPPLLFPLTTRSWLAEGKDIKAEVHLSFSLFAAFDSYHNSAQKNISAHHHGGNCNVKPKMWNHKVQDTRTRSPGGSKRRDPNYCKKCWALEALLKQFILNHFFYFQKMGIITDDSELN